MTVADPRVAPMAVSSIAGLSLGITLVVTPISMVGVAWAAVAAVTVAFTTISMAISMTIADPRVATMAVSSIAGPGVAPMAITAIARLSIGVPLVIASISMVGIARPVVAA